MKFFIFGDSWGVGEWRLQDGCHVSVPDTGIDHWLRNLGHHCTNVSVGSASNFGQLRNTYWTLKENSDYDYIIWFYTEPFRDIIETVINDPEEAKIQYPEFDSSDFPRCSYITQQNLQYAQMIYDEFKIPFVVIGGQCPLPDEINKHTFCRHQIKNWPAELLDLDFDFPEYTWFAWSKFRQIFAHFNLNEKNFVLSESENLDKVSVIVKKSNDSDQFPDNGHPGRAQFKNLSHRVLALVQ
jgi:hypothetical protein